MAMKGAIRELRKDANFLAKVELQKIREKDAEYQGKMKRIMGLLSEEQGEANKETRKKRKKF
jgi:nucleolar protein 14